MKQRLIAYGVRYFWLVATFFAVVAMSISLFIGLNQSVWFDEAYSILLAEHSPGEIIRLTAQDVHPPVYYLLLKAWMTLFGSSELALRSMSALFLGLSIGVAGFLLRRLFGAKVALVALPFLAFAPFLLRYGFEIRMYALCSLIGIGATYVLVAAVEEKSQKQRRLLFLVYALLVAIGVYTLYFMVLLFAAHLAWVAYLAYTERRKDTMLYAAAAYTFSLVLFLPWLPVFLDSASGGSLSSVTQSLGLENLYGILTYLFLYESPWKVTSIGLLGIVLFLAAIAAFGQGFRNATKKERRYLVLLAMYFFVPVLLLFVVTNIKPIYTERYNAHTAIGLYALVGVLVALSLRNASRFAKAGAGWALLVLFFGCISLARYGNYNFQRLHTPSVKQVASALSDCKNGATIFADGPQVAMELMYYVKDCPVYFFNETLEMDGGYAMISNSSLRVASPSELPSSEKIFHIHYGKPKNTISAPYEKVGEHEFEAVHVVTYQAKGVY